MPSQKSDKIVSGTSSSKLLSRLILLRFTLRIPISLQQNVTSAESSSKESKPSKSSFYAWVD